MTKRRVLITGLGAITPLGNSVAATWEAAKNSVSGAGPITRFDPADFTSRIAAEVKGFDPLKYMETKEVKKLDLFSQFALGASQQAWEDSGLATVTTPRQRMGCVLGIGIGGLITLEKYHKTYLEEGTRRISPFLIPAMISNLGPGNVAIKLGLKGTNFTVTSACTSSTHAIGESYRMIADGIQDVMVTGGSEAAVCHMGIGGFCAMKALSTRNDQPSMASRPFDRDRDGFVMGEGAATLILESYEHATQRGAKVYGEILGYGASCDAYHITAPCADGAGAIECMKLALSSAGLAPEQVSYVNAHGTSTEANDITETTAIKAVFGDWAKKGLVVSSTKSMTGHLLGAAGAIEALFCTMAIKDGIVPPTINLDNPADGCDLDYVPNKARSMNVNIVISNSFGFGGTNGSLVIGKAR